MVKNKYHKIVSDYVTPILIKADFEMVDTEWFYRWVGDAYWRVACDLTRKPGLKLGTMGITVGVGFRSLAELLKGFSLVKPDVNKPCAMATDLGHLRPPYQYHEWIILPETDENKIGQEIAEAIKDYGLAFFEKYGTLEKAVTAWEAGIHFNSAFKFYLPAVYWMRGERERALNIVRENIAYYDAKYKEKKTQWDWMVEPVNLRSRKEHETFLAFLVNLNI
jgi:hypothetical protein